MGLWTWKYEGTPLIHNLVLITSAGCDQY